MQEVTIEEFRSYLENIPGGDKSDFRFMATNEYAERMFIIPPFTIRHLEGRVLIVFGVSIYRNNIYFIRVNTSKSLSSDMFISRFKYLLGISQVTASNGKRMMECVDKETQSKIKELQLKYWLQGD